MNVEELREYCLSLGDVEEKIPFGKFARRYDSTLVFYVKGHMFCMFDLDDFTWVAMRSTDDEMVRSHEGTVDNINNNSILQITNKNVGSIYEEELAGMDYVCKVSHIILTL